MELLDLIESEGNRGIISKEAVVETMLTQGIPRLINDIRGALRLTVDRDGASYSVTQHPTALAMETIGEIYPVANPATDNMRPANDNGIDYMNQAA